MPKGIIATIAVLAAAGCSGVLSSDNTHSVTISWVEASRSSGTLFARLAGSGGCTPPTRIDVSVASLGAGDTATVTLDARAEDSAIECLVATSFDTTVTLDLGGRAAVWLVRGARPGGEPQDFLFLEDHPPTGTREAAGTAIPDTFAGSCPIINVLPPGSHQLVYAVDSALVPGPAVFVTGVLGLAPLPNCEALPPLHLLTVRGAP